MTKTEMKSVLWRAFNKIESRKDAQTQLIELVKNFYDRGDHYSAVQLFKEVTQEAMQMISSSDTEKMLAKDYLMIRDLMEYSTSILTSLARTHPRFKEDILNHLREIGSLGFGEIYKNIWLSVAAFKPD